MIFCQHLMMLLNTTMKLFCNFFMLCRGKILKSFFFSFLDQWFAIWVGIVRKNMLIIVRNFFMTSNIRGTIVFFFRLCWMYVSNVLDLTWLCLMLEVDFSCAAVCFDRARGRYRIFAPLFWLSFLIEYWHVLDSESQNQKSAPRRGKLHFISTQFKIPCSYIRSPIRSLNSWSGSQKINKNN